MAINWSRDLYLPTQNFFSIPVTFFPVFSQPGARPYAGRGIFDTRQAEVVAEDGSIFSDQQTILDIRTAEYPVPPKQKDRVRIPRDSSDAPLGNYEIMETSENGGGEMTLVLRKWEPSAPRPAPAIQPKEKG